MNLRNSQWAHRESCGPRPDDEGLDAHGEQLEADGAKLRDDSLARECSGTEVCEMVKNAWHNGQFESYGALERRDDSALLQLERIGKQEHIPPQTFVTLGDRVRNG